MKWAVPLLVLFVARHYGYLYVDRPAKGYVFMICGALCIIALVMMLKPWGPLAVWILAEESQVAGCSIWWLYDPIPNLGDEQCSTRTGIKLGLIGTFALGWVAAGLLDKLREPKK